MLLAKLPPGHAEVVPVVDLADGHAQELIGIAAEEVELEQDRRDDLA